MTTMFNTTPSTVAIMMDSSDASIYSSTRSSCANSSISCGRANIGYSLSSRRSRSTSSTTSTTSTTSFDGGVTGSTAGSSVRQVRKNKVQIITPDFCNTIYDSIRESVAIILTFSTKLKLESSRGKGVVLVCGKDDDVAAKDGFGVTIVPLKISVGGHDNYVDNPLIHALAKFACHNDCYEELPDVIVGLCCNNWGHYNGRNALIEALLEIMGPHSDKLSIHSAIYALDFNVNALGKIIPSSNVSNEESATRILHAQGFQETARKYNIGLDRIEKDHDRFQGLSKEAFAELLSNATIQAVERSLSSNLPAQERVLDLVLEILKQRKLIQENLTNKKFRRARSTNLISVATQSLQETLLHHFDEDELDSHLSCRIPGWTAFAESAGGAGAAVLRLFCHSVDVLAGCVSRAGSVASITPDVAERLVLTLLEKESRLLEYVFNQVYDLMPSCSAAVSTMGVPNKIYIYRKSEDVHMFSTISCGVAEMGGKL